MYLKRLLAFLCCFTLVFCLFPSSAFATGGNGNIDGGGGGMGQGTSSNFWTPGNDGVRITVVDASSGTAVSSPLDFSNRTQKTSLLHFGKVNKLQYLSGTGLSLQSGAAYSCIKPAQSMPTIVSSKGQSNIEAIKRYFCSEYACMMVAQAARVDYERMIAGEYKLLIEPIAYFTHNGQYYCMAKNWTPWTMRGTPSTSGIRKASWGAALSGYILPCAGWHEKSMGSATLITAAGGVQMGFPPPCPSGSRRLTLLMAANSSSHRKDPHSRLPSAMPMVRKSSASTGVKRTWLPN